MSKNDKKDNIKIEEHDAQPEEQGQKEKKGEAKDEEIPLTSDEKEQARTTEPIKSPNSKLLESLNEENIQKLLSAKQECEEKDRSIEEKNNLLLEYEDLLKRRQAEFENYSKRMKRELDESKKYATVELLLDILNAIDNFERAIDSAKVSKDFDALLEGIVITETQLKSVLEKKYGVMVIDDVGKDFDPNTHDAIMMEESDKFAEDTVIENLQKGYRMYDRIIRHAKVKVAKAASSPDEQEQREGDGPESSPKGV
jgi:molecular chaperone GrpE